MTETQQGSPAVPPAEPMLARVAGRIVIGMARHWLLIFNAVWAIYVFTPFLAPIWMEIGWQAPAAGIYAIYSILCHQLPDHSYFLFGPSLVPQTPALIAGGMQAGASLLIERAFIGNADIGWKVALCQRDVAIYLSVFGAGLSYIFVRTWTRPLPLKFFILLTIPMAIDGLTQLVGWRESNWWLRSVTGALFGAAAVYLVYPYVEDAMQDVLYTELRRRTAPVPVSQPDRAA